MKKLMLSTAILAAMTLGANAQSEQASESGEMFRSEADPQLIHASNFIGMRVYSAEGDVEAAEGVGDNWEDIGEINDVILARDGTVDSVLVDIGGFLGIGERTVALNMSSVQFVPDDSTADDETDFFLVINAPVDQLEEAPAYGEGMAATEEAEMEEDTEVAEAAEEVEDGAEETADAADAAAEEVEEGAEQTAENTEEVIEEGAEETADAADAAAEEVEEGAEETAAAADAAAEEVEEGAEQTAEATEEAVEEGAEEVAEAGDAAEAEIEEGAEEVADAEMEVVDEGAEEGTETAATDGGATMVPADPNATATGTDMAAGDAAAPVSPRDGYGETDLAQLTTEDLQGAEVYGSDDQNIGEVSELILAEDGKITQAVLDVGGFLGLGEKRFAVPMEELEILRQQDSNDVRIFISKTEEELKAMPEYEEG